MQEYQNCNLCPRACGVNRVSGQKGFCGATSSLRVGRAMLHQWEEPPISGENGSGAIFFSHCTLGCVFCQNRMISRREAQGVEISPERLAQIFLELEHKGAHNINLISATHYTPHLLEAIPIAREAGLQIPILLNSGGYESQNTLALLNGMIDIYLPDFKYYSGYYAGLYSGAPDYFDVADQAISTMVRQTGALNYDDSGLLVKGTIIRHLMLPGMLGDTKQVLRHIAEKWGDQVLVSLMRQYTPIDMQDFPELNRAITEEAYQEATEYFEMLGLCGFFQDSKAAMESFIPSFGGEGVTS